MKDRSSSYDESIGNNVNKIKPPQRFSSIGSADDEALKKLSPFATQKGIQGLAGEPKTEEIEESLAVSGMLNRESL